MSNIEQALHWAQDIITETDDFLPDCSENLKRELIEQRGFVVTVVGVLQEKLARESGCEYCLGDDPTPIVNLDINNDDVTEGDISFGFAEPLRFCPMCGKGVKRD